MFWTFETWEIMQDKVFTEHKNKIKSDFFSINFFSKITSTIKTKTYDLCSGHVKIRLKNKFYKFRV